MTPARFRKLALSHEGATESAHMNHPDFRHENGRIFATLNEDETRGMVKVPAELQEAALADESGAFEAAAGAWGKAGCTYVHLKSAPSAMVKAMLAEAWTMAGEAKSTRAKKSTWRAKTASKKTTKRASSRSKRS
jgi:hypothetical protein